MFVKGGTLDYRRDLPAPAWTNNVDAADGTVMEEDEEEEEEEEEVAIVVAGFDGGGVALLEFVEVAMLAVLFAWISPRILDFQSSKSFFFLVFSS